MASRRFRLAAFAALGIAALLVTPGGAAAQLTARASVEIDYVNADGVYLSLGSEDGLVEGDTVVVFDTPDGTREVTRLRLVTVTRRRSVALPVDDRWPERGETLYLALSRSAHEEPALPRDAGAAPVGPDQTLRPTSSRDASTPATPDLSGRLSLDVQARESRTSWSGDLSGAQVRRYATPTLRLSLLGTDLPGGLEARISARSAYRYSSAFTGPPTMSTRVYEASLTRRLDGAPVQLTLGRFVNPYESYGGFWDGMMLRVGGRRGLGAGVAVGFEPRMGDEAPSTDHRKVTGFVDLSAGGTGWWYDSDLSFQLLGAGEPGTVRTAGWRQSVGFGPVSIRHRVAIGLPVDGGSTVLRRAQIGLGLRLHDRVRLRGTFHRRGEGAFAELGLDLPTGAPVAVIRDAATVGVDLSGRAATLSVSAGRSGLADEEPGRSFSALGTLRLRGLRLAGGGRVQSLPGRTGLSLTSGASGRLAGFDTALSYRLYRTETVARLQTHAAGLRLQRPLLPEFTALLGVEHQWGIALSGTSLRIGLWRSF